MADYFDRLAARALGPAHPAPQVATPAGSGHGHTWHRSGWEPGASGTPDPSGSQALEALEAFIADADRGAPWAAGEASQAVSTSRAVGPGSGRGPGSAGPAPGSSEPGAPIAAVRATSQPTGAPAVRFPLPAGSGAERPDPRAATTSRQAGPDPHESSWSGPRAGDPIAGRPANLGVPPDLGGPARGAASAAAVTGSLAPNQQPGPAASSAAPRQMPSPGPASPAAAPQAVVRITIGRIDVRATAPAKPAATPPAPARPVPATPRLTLDAYLERSDRRRR